MYEELKGSTSPALERQTRAFCAGDRRPLPRLRRAAAARADRVRVRRAAALGPAVLLPRPGPTTTCSRPSGSSQALRADARRARHRPARAAERAPRHRAAAAARARARSARRCSVPDEVYLVIPRQGGRDDYAALFHEGGHTEHYANVDAVAAVRVPPSRRQLRHRGIRVPVRAPDRGPGLARDGAGRRGRGPARRTRLSRGRQARLPAPLRGQARLRAGAARRRAAARRDAGRSTRGGWAMRSESSGRRCSTCPTSTRATTPPTTCAPGRSRRSCAARCASASAPSGSSAREAGDLLRALWREGQRLDADELLAQVDRRALDFGVMIAEV